MTSTTTADLYAYLAQHPDLGPDQILSLVRTDQQTRWQRGERVSAEEYFASVPGLQSDEEAALVVLCGEFLLALTAGLQPSIESFQVRFPLWADRLSLQLGLELALVETVTLPLPAGVEAAPTLPNIPGYDLLDVLGEGAMGTVYRAVHRGLQKCLALKLLKKVATPEQEFTLLLEARLLARLNHPGIVPVLDAGTSEGHAYLVMQIFEGGTLADRLNGEPQPEDFALSMVEQLARAVQHAHQIGVIHRDIKPANVLLAQDGSARLADFGLARLEVDLPDLGTIAGTPRYMAPELARGEPATTASDIWALGAVLYELLSGRPVFPGPSLVETFDQVLFAKVTPLRQFLPRVSRDLEAIVARCLCREASQRYSSASALADDLAAYRKGLPVSARRPPLGERLVRWFWRHPGVTASLAGLLVLVVTIGMAVFLVNDRLEQTRVEGLVETLCRAEPGELPRYLAEIRPHLTRAAPLLRARLQEPGQRLAASLALLSWDDERAEELLAQVPIARPEWIAHLRVALRNHVERVTPTLWDWLSTEGPLTARLRAACLLANYHPHDERWPTLAPVVLRALREENPLHIGRWQEELDPIGAHLVPELGRHLPTLSPGSAEETLATNLFVHWAADQPTTLARRITQVDGRPFTLILAALQRQPNAGRAALRNCLAEETEPRCRRAAIALFRLGEHEPLTPLLRHGANPSVRSELIHRVAPLGIDPVALAPLLRDQADASIQRAIVLALGEYPPEQVITAHEWLLPWLLERSGEDTDPGLRSAIAWLLRGPWAKLDRSERIPSSDAVFARIQGVPFTMGTQPGEQRKDSPLHERNLTRTYILASHKVSVASFEKFLKDNPRVIYWAAAEYSPKSDGPIIAVSWYHATAYCNWLSRREGLPETEWCYLPNAAGVYGPGMRPAPNALTRTGYRLPTEAEWEFACRAGATTRFPHGTGEDLLGRYAWYVANAGGLAHPSGRLKPNDLGLFDMLGNAWEWCHETHRPYPDKQGDDPEDGDEVRDDRPRILRGGSYVDRPGMIHPGLRCVYPPDGKDCSVGFRVARTWRGARP